MNTAPDPAERRVEFACDLLFDRHDLVALLRRRWCLLVLLPVVGAALALGYSLLRTPLYESSALLMVDSSLDQLLQFEQVEQGGDTVRESLKSLEVALVADSVVLRVVDKLDLRESPGFLPDDLAKMAELPDTKLLEFLRKERIKASLQPETRLIRISVLDTDPARARLIAATFLEEFEAFLADQRRDEVEKVRGAIVEQVAEAKEAAIRAEQDLEEFRKKTGFLPVEQDHDLFAERLSQFGSDLNEAVRNRVELQGLYQSLEDLDPEEDAIEIIEVAGYRDDSHVASMLTALAESRSRFAAAGEQFTPSNPKLLSVTAEVERNREQIEELARDIQSTAGARYRAARKREELLRKELGSLEEEYSRIKAEGAEFRALYEESENRWLHYQSLQKRLSNNIISTEMPGKIATVISEPLTPHSEAGPPWILFGLVGGVAGGLLSFGIVFAKIVRGLPFSNRRQLEDRYPFPVLADWTDSDQTRSPRSLLPFLLSTPSKLIHVTTPGLRQAGQAVARDMASSIAAIGRETLVIEVKAEVQKPSIEETSIPCLSRLEISPEDLYDEKKFLAVLPRLRDTYRHILLDSGSYDEPLLTDWLGSLSDREVIVVGGGLVSKHQVAARVRRIGHEDPSRAGFLFVSARDFIPGNRPDRPARDGRQAAAGIGFSPPVSIRRIFRRPSAA